MARRAFPLPNAPTETLRGQLDATLVEGSAFDMFPFAEAAVADSTINQLESARSTEGSATSDLGSVWQSDDDLRLLAKQRVPAFLLARPLLDKHLETIRRKASSDFPDCRLELIVSDDPEAGGSPTLVVFVHTSLPRAEARARLRLFERKWWQAIPFDERQAACLMLGKAG
jgi:hypothetical protein